jgi:hypothetical protein
VQTWSLSRGPVGRHLAEVQRPSPERYDPPGVVQINDGRQGDPGSSEAGQHHPVILEQLLLLRLQGTIGPIPPRLLMEFPVNAGSANSVSFLK